MSTTTINTHYGKNIKWTVYRNGYNAFVGTLTLDGSAYDISSRVFTAYIRTPQGTDNKLTLTEGSGITNGGATGLLTIALTEAQLATLPRDRYFIVIEYTIDSKDYPLCQGYIETSSETNPGTTTTSATIPVNINGATVSMAVTLAGASVTSSSIATALGAQTATHFYGGPTPSFRAIAAADLPATVEFTTNKATDFTTINDTKYPSVEAVKEYVKGLNVIDANAAPYSCTPNDSGYDNSAGIEAVIQAAATYAAANNSVAFVEFSDGEYYLTRALQQTSAAGVAKYNCQVPLPWVPTGSGTYPVVVIRPKVSRPAITPVQTYFGNFNVGVTFRSTLTAQTYSATYGWPAVFGGPDPQRGQAYNANYSFVSIQWQNITVKVPEAPTVMLFQDALIARNVYNNVSGVVHKVGATVAQPTSPLGVFNAGPAYNNNGYFLEGTILCIGLYAGPAIAEHITHGGFITVADCYVGLRLAAPSWSGGKGFFHYAQLNVVSTEGTIYGITATDENGISASTLGGNSVSGFSSSAAKIGVYINQWDIEEGGGASWNSGGTRYHIYDPSDVLSGEINYGRTRYLVGSVGQNDNTGFVMSGGSYLKLNNILKNEGPTAAVRDNFGRANSTTTLGNTETPGTAWTAETGTWGVISNRAYCVSAVASGATTLNKAIVSAGKADLTLRCDVVISGATPAVNLIYRYSDASNYLFVDVSQSTVQLWKKVAGAVTQLGSTYTATITKDIPWEFKIITSGNSHTVYINGVSRITATDAFNNTAQSVGMGVVSGASLSSNAQRFKNFTVY